MVEEKKDVEKKENKIEFFNGTFDIFLNPELAKPVNKLRVCAYGDSAADFDVYCEEIINSPAFKGYVNQRNKLIADYKEKNPDADMAKVTVDKVEGLVALLNKKSKLKLEKVVINRNEINTYGDPEKDLNSNDYAFLKALVVFVKE